MKVAAAIIVAAGLAAGGERVLDPFGWHSSAISVPDGSRVASIRLDGPSLPITTFKHALRTQVGAALRDGDLTADRAELVDLLVERGHLAAAVAPPTVSWGPSGAHVNFAVTPGPRYQIRSVNLTGASDLAEAASVPMLAPGDDISVDRVARGAELLVQWFSDRGVSRATVAYRLDVDDNDHAVDVTYTIVHARRLARR